MRYTTLMTLILLAIHQAQAEENITWKKKLSANLYKFKYRKEWERLKEYLN